MQRHLSKVSRPAALNRSRRDSTMLMIRDVDPCHALGMPKFKYLGPVYACTCCSRANLVKNDDTWI